MCHFLETNLIFFKDAFFMAYKCLLYPLKTIYTICTDHVLFGKSVHCPPPQFGGRPLSMLYDKNWVKPHTMWRTIGPLFQTYQMCGWDVDIFFLGKLAENQQPCEDFYWLLTKVIEKPIFSFCFFFFCIGNTFVF